MKNLPSIKQLEYLVALDQSVHFGKAAELCHVTPSTLSAGIKDLENLLGIALAERSKRHVHMTSIGREIALRARHLLRDSEDIMALAKSNKAPMTGDLKLGVIPTIVPFLLPKAITELNEKYPKLRFFLEEDLSEKLLDRLQQGELDLVLMALPYDTRNFEVAHILDDEFFFACHPKHELSVKKLITNDDLKKQPLMLLEEGHCLRSHVLEACKLKQMRSRTKLEASSFYTLVQMVASGIGATLLPKLAIDAKITANTQIKITPLDTPSYRQIALVWRKSVLRKNDYKILTETLRNI